MPEIRRGILVVVALAACAGAALGQMNCNASGSGATVQADNTSAPVGDFILTCSGGGLYTATGTPIPTLNLTVTMADPITNPILSTSGGNVSDIYLMIDDPGTVASAASATPGFGSSAPPTVCSYNANSTHGCPAYPNTFTPGGIPVMTSAPNPLGSPNTTPPAANIYQGVVSGNVVTFYGVPILPPNLPALTRTYRITNLRVNAAAGHYTPVTGAVTISGGSYMQIAVPDNQAILAGVQAGSTALAAGNSFLTPGAAAPGGLIYLYVQGVGNQLVGPVSAGSFPLPTSLAGISVTLQDSNITPQSRAVPILAVNPVSTCMTPPVPVSGTCGRYTVITIEMPIEFQQAAPAATPVRAYLSVSENGVSGSVVQVTPLSDAVRVLSTCVEYPCNSAVTHADGTLVTTNTPAKPGEEVVLWAVGLGPTTPAVPTGQATPQPAPVTQETFQLNFDFRSNAPPYRPVCATPTACLEAEPVFAGLTPGYAGLYQVNFIVPPPPAGTPPCDGSTITSNLTVSLLGSGSFDGARICVDPGSAAPSTAAAHRSGFRPAVPAGFQLPHGDARGSIGASKPF